MKERPFFARDTRAGWIISRSHSAKSIGGPERDFVGMNASEMSFAPTFEEISARAYQFYLDENRPEGKQFEHWVRAEADLAAETRKLPDEPNLHFQRPTEQQRNR